MDQNSNKPTGSSVLRVASIIMIVFAVINLGVGLLMLMGVFFASADDMVGVAAGVAAVIGVVAFIGGLLNLFVGVVGLNASKRNDKNTLAFVLGVVSVIYGIYGIVSAISTGDGGSIANAFVGIILPALYLYGVIQTRKGIA